MTLFLFSNLTKPLFRSIPKDDPFESNQRKGANLMKGKIKKIQLVTSLLCMFQTKFFSFYPDILILLEKSAEYFSKCFWNRMWSEYEIEKMRHFSNLFLDFIQVYNQTHLFLLLVILNPSICSNQTTRTLIILQVIRAGNSKENHCWEEVIPQKLGWHWNHQSSPCQRQ